MDLKYITATDLARAWLNFELDLPLEVEPDGPPNPFYVDRPGNPVAELDDVQRAGSEIRNEYRRILTADQRRLLQEVHAENQLNSPTNWGR